ncbi:hypothetical protein CLD22_10290 [Rubrivivax gelatinosus]|nr:hypothetical protein [Rubrivivax gelatinosus]
MNTPRTASLLQTLRAVAWSFFGVRRRADHEEDVRRLNPALVVGVGIAAALVFVIVLLLLVRWVVASGVAT